MDVSVTLPPELVDVRPPAGATYDPARRDGVVWATAAATGARRGFCRLPPR